MAHHGQRAVLYRLCDSVSGANWRPTRSEDRRTIYSCQVCHVVPSKMVVLPCVHILCEQCLTGSIVQGGGRVCPLDGMPISDDECQWLKFPAKTTNDIKAHCWNEADGCQFVGTIEAVLLHFEKRCTFHAIECPRCGQRMLRTEIAAHYVAGCSQNACCERGAQPNRPPTDCRTTATLNRLSALQARVDEVLTICKTLEPAQSQSIDRVGSGFENCIREMKSIEVNICSMVTQQLNAGLEDLKTVIRDHQTTVQSQGN
ncbi:hypothetical protein MTO96_045378 [Rhipicephalus appendiculatus]